jgi:hypothetical protein
MSNTGRWLVYNRADGEFIFLSKPFKTKERADRERTKLRVDPEYARASVGVGFVRTSMMKTKSAKPRPRLNPTQQDCPANFADASFDYPKKSFQQVARFLLGPKPFPKTKNGEFFKKVCREVFDREREK